MKNKLAVVVKNKPLILAKLNKDMFFETKCVMSHFVMSHLCVMTHFLTHF